MERELFTWKIWDYFGNLLVFHNCTLVKPVRDYEVGDIIHTINIDYKSLDTS
jgi:hypothetical protein